jgi:hypothetical protein
MARPSFLPYSITLNCNIFRQLSDNRIVELELRVLHSCVPSVRPCRFDRRQDKPMLIIAFLCLLTLPEEFPVATVSHSNCADVFTTAPQEKFSLC